MELKNKTILITGGSEGLGLSLARALVTNETTVHIIGRSEDKLSKAKEETSHENLVTHSVDVSDYKKLKEVIDAIGNIDVLINNAGVWIEGELTELDEEAISSAIDINTKGVIYTTKYVLPNMLKADDGFILNVSSTSGLKGRENQSVYVASKFAVQGFTESLKLELKKTNVKVVGFYPGGMNTKLFDKAGSPKQNDDWMDTDKVAKVIKFILELDDSMILDHVVLNKRGTKTSN